jgi:hypothetical protein
VREFSFSRRFVSSAHNSAKYLQGNVVVIAEAIREGP